MTQMAMNICAQQAYKAADEDLNADYQMAIESLKSYDEDSGENTAGGEEILRNTQRAWIKYRDNNCGIEAYFYQGGSIRPMIINSCMERMTRQRSEELRTLFEEN